AVDDHPQGQERAGGEHERPRAHAVAHLVGGAFAEGELVAGAYVRVPFPAALDDARRALAEADIRTRAWPPMEPMPPWEFMPEVWHARYPRRGTGREDSDTTIQRGRTVTPARSPYRRRRTERGHRAARRGSGRAVRAQTRRAGAHPGHPDGACASSRSG